MALGDLILSAGRAGTTGGRLYNVAAGTPIYAGEPVQVVALGNTVGNVVVPALTNTPDASAHLYVGVAETNSTNTASAAGTVIVQPLASTDTWLAKPDDRDWETESLHLEQYYT